MASPRLRGASYGNSASASSQSVHMADVSGAAVGDLCIIKLIGASSSQQINSAPTGWTEVFNVDAVDFNAAVYTKTLVSGDLSSDPSWGWGASQHVMYGFILIEAGTHNGVDVSAHTEAVSATSPWAAKSIAQALTTTVDDTMIITFCSHDVSGVTAGTVDKGFQLIDAYETNDWLWLFASYEYFPTAGASTRTVTHNYSSEQDMCIARIAVAPDTTRTGVQPRGVESGTMVSSATGSVDFTGYSAGDLAFVQIARASSATPTATPTGWTELHSLINTIGTWLYYKELAAGDISSPPTWTWSGAAFCRAVGYVLEGHNTGSPIDTSNAGVNTNTGAGTAIDHGDVTSSEGFLFTIGSAYGTTRRKETSMSVGGFKNYHQDGGITEGTNYFDVWIWDTDGAWGGGNSDPAGTLDGTASWRFGFQVAVAVASSGFTASVAGTLGTLQASATVSTGPDDATVAAVLGSLQAAITAATGENNTTVAATLGILEAALTAASGPNDLTVAGTLGQMESAWTVANAGAAAMDATVAGTFDSLEAALTAAVGADDATVAGVLGSLEAALTVLVEPDDATVLNATLGNLEASWTVGNQANVVVSIAATFGELVTTVAVEVLNPIGAQTVSGIVEIPRSPVIKPTEGGPTIPRQSTIRPQANNRSVVRNPVIKMRR